MARRRPSVRSPRKPLPTRKKWRPDPGGHRLMSWRAERRQADRSGDSAMSTSRDDSHGAKLCTACSTDSADPVIAGDDGYCPSCGRRVMADRDHMEEELRQAGRVRDPG